MQVSQVPNLIWVAAHITSTKATVHNAGGSRAAIARKAVRAVDTVFEFNNSSGGRLRIVNSLEESPCGATSCVELHNIGKAIGRRAAHGVGAHTTRTRGRPLGGVSQPGIHAGERSPSGTICITAGGLDAASSRSAASGSAIEIWVVNRTATAGPGEVTAVH